MRSIYSIDCERGKIFLLNSSLGWSLHRYNALNLLSYMTLDVQNIHSVVLHKDKLFTVLYYPWNFENVA